MAKDGLSLYLNTEELASTLKEFAAEVQRDVHRAVKELASNAEAHVALQAGEELSSPVFKKFIEHLDLTDVSPGIWVISIDEKALWIEEGIEPGMDMKKGLLGSSKAKTSAKTGYKYMVVPFDQGKARGDASGYEFNLRERVRYELRRRKIPFKKLENYLAGPNKGQPIVSEKPLHTLNVGPQEYPGKASTPVLDRVNIYQRMGKNGKVRRDITTFRTVSGDPKYADKWIHPGRKANKFLEEALEWAQKEWETEFLPKIVEKWGR